MDRLTAFQSSARHENSAYGLATVLTVGLAAGLAGGLAEIGWIGFYDLMGGVSSRAVAGFFLI